MKPYFDENNNLFIPTEWMFNTKNKFGFNAKEWLIYVLMNAENITKEELEKELIKIFNKK